MALCPRARTTARRPRRELTTWNPLKVALGKAQEKVTLLEAALMRLQGEIKVAEDAGDAGTLAGLREGDRDRVLN